MHTQSYLKECLEYDDGSGVFTWKERPLSHFSTRRGHSVFNSQKSGARACHTRADGYLEIRISDEVTKKKSRILAHVAAWTMVNGEIPEGMMIDHISMNRGDNSISNLRLCIKSQNMMNSRSRPGSSSRFKGVFASCGKFYAQIQITPAGEKRKRFTFKYESEIDAAICYDRMAKRIHGKFARINLPCMDIGYGGFVLIE